jgi:transcriptional regulator with XRE-family HTH domain
MSDISPIVIYPTAVTDCAQFGRILRAARQANGVTAEALAELLGWSRTTVTSRETGVRGVHVDDAVQALESLGYSLVVVSHELAERLQTRAEASS